MKIFVVVPVRNRKEITRQFLLCMQNQTYQNRKIILVDDGSTDGTSEMVCKDFPWVYYMKGNGNLWWTGGVNLGLGVVLDEALSTDAVLIINDDLEFEKDYLEKLQRDFVGYRRTILGSVVADVKRPDMIVDGGRLINWWTAKHKILNKGCLISDLNVSKIEVSTLTGRGVLFPVSVFRDVGLYDQEHFEHRGDTELPVRAKNRAGYELLVSYNAVVRSYVDQTYSVDVAQSYGFKDIKSYFFDLRSSGRLRFRFFFALATRKNWLQFCFYLLCDISRVTYYFLSRFSFK